MGYCTGERILSRLHWETVTCLPNFLFSLTNSSTCLDFVQVAVCPPKYLLPQPLLQNNDHGRSYWPMIAYLIPEESSSSQRDSGSLSRRKYLACFPFLTCLDFRLTPWEAEALLCLERIKPTQRTGCVYWRAARLMSAENNYSICRIILTSFLDNLKRIDVYVQHCSGRQVTWSRRVLWEREPSKNWH